MHKFDFESTSVPPPLPFVTLGIDLEANLELSYRFLKDLRNQKKL